MAAAQGTKVTGRSGGRARSDERGHLLVGLVVLLACMMIMLTAAAQSWTFLVRRDKEAEMIYRGEEYARAIVFYQKEVGSYPLKLDLLAQKGPHGHRFIRKLYKDPIAEDGEWGLLYLSPTGQGFINPYATQLGEGFGGPGGPMDPFSSGGLGIGVGGAGNNPGAFGSQGSGFGSGSRKSGFGKSSKSSFGKDKKPGYSELDQETYKSFEGVNMPIVGVVHKKEEWGIKYYKGQASLNDWAFTMLDQGEQHHGGGKGQHPTPKWSKRQGIGDAHNPIFLPGMLPPPKKGGNSLSDQRGNLETYQDEQDRLEAEREALLNPDAPADPNSDPNDPNYDPNDPNADPNAAPDDGSDDEDPNSNGEDEEGDEGEDPNGP